MAILNQLTPQPSDEELFKQAEELLDDVITVLPDYNSYLIDEVFAKHNRHHQKKMQSCRRQIEKLLRINGIVETGDLNLQLRTTAHGREIKKQTIERKRQEEELKKAQRKPGTFNEKANAIIIYLLDRSVYSHIAVINYELSKVFEKLNLSEIMHELERLGLISVQDDSFLLKQPVKKEIAIMPKEFDGKPYEYFLDKENREKENAATFKWYETENARQTFLDFPNIKRRSNVAIGVSITTIIVTILLELIKWNCNKSG